MEEMAADLISQSFNLDYDSGTLLLLILLAVVI